MKQKLPSLFFGAMSIICACIIVALAPVYVSDVHDLYGHITFTDIDWWLTAWNTLAFSAATFLMLICAADAVIGVILACKKWNDD